MIIRDDIIAYNDMPIGNIKDLTSTLLWFKEAKNAGAVAIMKAKIYEVVAARKPVDK